MAELYKQSNTPERGGNQDANKDRGLERLESLAESESRYRPGEYRVEISPDAAKEDIERNFPDFVVEKIEYLSEGMANIVFLVNGDFIFRFAKSEKANVLCEKEVKALAKIKERVDLDVPVFEYVGSQRNGLRVVGYKKIEGKRLEKSDIVNHEGEVDKKLTGQLANFFQQLHSIDVGALEEVGLRNRDTRQHYENRLADAREYIYPVVEQVYPKESQQIKDYIEKIFAGYLGDEENLKYKPAVLHGDLEAEHIIFDPVSRKIAGIIDWGGVRIGDPDYDLFRPYSHYGSEFIDEFLKYYPHLDVGRLRYKIDFFFREQMAHRTVRAIMLGDQKRTAWHLERLRKQALGIGYWYNELREL